MTVRVVAALWLLHAAAVGAGEVVEIVVERSDARYRVVIDARFDAPVERVRGLLTDFPHLGRINDSIRHSEVLATLSPQRHRVRTEARVCVALLCKDIAQVQDVAVLPNGDLEATVRPADSDFRYGAAYWEFRAQGAATHMRFRSEIEPAFWVPPLIGPWLIRRALHAEATKTIANLERLAEAGSP